MSKRFHVLLSFVSAFGCGCTITLGDGSALLDDDSGTVPGDTPRLPDPTTSRV